MSDTTETETETNTDNTDSDEPTKAELHDRVQQLESTVAKLMPSRRDALKLGAAGLAGAAGLGAASQSADAATGSAGTIGSNSDRPDLIADDVDANTLNIGKIQDINLQRTTDISSSRSLDTEFQNTTGNTFLLRVQVVHSPSSGNVDMNLNLYVDAFENPSSRSPSQKERLQGGLSGGRYVTTFTEIIPPGYYYEIGSFASGGRIRAWFEMELA